MAKEGQKRVISILQVIDIWNKHCSYCFVWKGYSMAIDCVTPIEACSPVKIVEPYYK